MPAPYDYSINPGYINPAQAVMQGMQVGGGLLDLREQALQRDQAAAMRPIQQQQAELGLRVGLNAEQQMLAQQQMQAKVAQSAAVRAAEMEKALQDLRQNPSVEATHNFFMAYPEHPLAKQYDKVIAGRTDAQKEQDFRSMVQINAALDSGDVDAAERFMRTEAEKYGKAGDTEQQKTMLNAAEMLRNNPQAAHGAAQAMLVRLAPTIGKDITSLRTSESDVAKAEAEAKEAGAKAQISEAKAKTAFDQAIAELGLTKAQAAKLWADIQRDKEKLALDKAKAAEGEKMPADVRKVVQEVDNFAGNIKRNIGKVIAQIEKTGTFELTGPEGKFMDQWLNEIATDMAKLKDPGSVARESEVESEKKNLVDTGFTGLLTRNSTAQQVMRNLERSVEERRQQAYKARGIEAPAAEQPAASRGYMQKYNKRSGSGQTQ
jgi:hypothetical protein